MLDLSGAPKASVCHFLMPPLGIAFTWLVLGEHVESRDLLGIIPVALGSYLVTRASATAVLLATKGAA
jgi:drug/metabolite transporter (DMT)-like permease